MLRRRTVRETYDVHKVWLGGNLTYRPPNHTGRLGNGPLGVDT